jgi:two-component system, sensor histidine kinase and response regulator
MHDPTEPVDEAQRLAALRALNVLDTPPEPCFDRLTRLAALLCGAPMAGLSLVDAERTWCKSSFGLPRFEIARQTSFEHHVIGRREALVVVDATRDPRFAAHPLVTGTEGVRCYVGQPIYSVGGSPLGALFVMDQRQREFPRDALAALSDLARTAELLLQSREVEAGIPMLLADLRAREEQFTATFEHAPVGIAHLRLDGRWLRTNAKLREMLGYSESELVGRNFQELTYPEDLGANRELYERARRGELDDYSVEKRYICRSGALLWTSVTVSVQRNAEGQPDYLISVVKDISDRKAVETELKDSRDQLRLEVERQTEQLRVTNVALRAQIAVAHSAERNAKKSETQLRLVADSFPAIIGYWDRNELCRFANKEHAKRFAVPIERIAGMSLEEVVGAETYAILKPHVANVLAGEARRFDFSRPQDGEERVWQAELVPDREGHEILGFSALLVDITDRKRDEERLLRQDVMLRHTSRLARVGGWELDPAKRESTWSDMVYEIYELPIGTPVVENRAFEGNYPPEARLLVESAITDAVTAGEPFDLVTPFVTCKGRRRWVRAIGEPVFVDGSCVRVFGAIQDVTEQHEARLRVARASRASAEGHWELDYESKTTWLSDTFRELLGYASEEVTISRDEFAAMVHPDDMATVRAALANHRETGEPYDVEVRLRRRDGSWRWYRSRGALDGDHNGRSQRFGGSLVDVDRERVARDELQRLRARFERAIHGTRHALWECDLATWRLWHSPRFYELVGWTEADVSDVSTYKALIHPDERALYLKSANAHLESGAPYDIEYRFYVRGQGYRWFRDRGSAERDASGRAVSFAGSFEDITAQKVAELARAEAEARLARAIDGGSDALFEWDLTQGTSSADLSEDAIWYSPRLREMLGYGSNEVLPTSVRELMSEEDRARMDAAVYRHIHHDEQYDVTVRLPTKQGTWRWIRGRGRCERDVHQRPIRFSGSLQDITRQREMEDELREATRAAAAASRAKGEFLANMSHEIRTPLNGVIGMAGLLLDTNLSQEQREYAELARSSGETLLALISDVLDFSKIEAEHLELESVDMELAAVVDEAIDAVALRAAEKGLELLVDVDPALPTWARGDPTRLRQVLLNLLSNAVKFTDHGEVLLRVHPVPSPEGRLGVGFLVKDSGIGIAPERRDAIFSPFTQADTSTTRRYGGTGLGLSICRRLIEAMGGAIRLESEPGSGSTFYVELYLEAARSLPMVSHPKVLAGARILLVNDHAESVRILRDQLAPLGARVTIAGSASEALLAVQTATEAGSAPELVLIESHLPDHRGEWLAERLKSGPDAPFLILLASLAETLSPESRSLFDRQLSKPVRLRSLLRLLETLNTAPENSHPEPAVSSTLDGCSVLLVEDQAVNAMLAERLLGRLGVHATRAHHGREALEWLKRQRFDLVLMDCQMPELDGYEATRQLRRAESGVLEPQVPVVAMTAHAMAGDREKCLAAGMDDYLTKPLDLARLKRTLEVVLERQHAATVAGLRWETPSPLFYPARLASEVGGDERFVHELVQVFLESGAAMLKELEHLIANGDWTEVRRLAHQLKGAAASVAAAPLSEIAAALESEAKKSRVQESTWETLGSVWQRTRSQMVAYHPTPVVTRDTA